MALQLPPIKTIGISLIMFVLIFGGAVFFSTQKNIPDQSTNNADNVSMDKDTQIISIRASRGYSPRNTLAKANIPTIIRMDAKGTYDCSTALSIPSLAYKEQLSNNQTVDIPVPPQESGATLRGVCSMGMYSFTIRFE